MPTHRRGKLVIGALTALVALTLLSLPAAANTVNVTVTAGTLTLKNVGGGTIQSMTLVPGPQCSGVVSTATTTGSSSSGTVSATLRAHAATTISGQHFVVTLTTALSGTYGGGPSAYPISGTGSATATIVRSTGAGSCTPLGGAGTCTVTASNVTWAGTLNAGDASVLVPGDTVTGVNGGNTAFNTVVTGTAANCGTITALNNGSVSITGGALLV